MLNTLIIIIKILVLKLPFLKLCFNIKNAIALKKALATYN